MKYIRTEDSVQKLGVDEELKKRGVVNYYYYKYKNIKMLMDKNDVKKYKQADTIEELCDEFVGIDKNGNHKKLPHPYFDNWTVFGAIWTDKGLIYVAKMNDKGELELL